MAALSSRAGASLLRTRLTSNVFSTSRSIHTSRAPRGEADSLKGVSPLAVRLTNSNAVYVSAVLFSAFVLGGGYSKLGDMVWDLNNRGKQFKDIDWSKWNSNWKSED